MDISAIKNTNTKIILRTPEANDREAVGRSMGLTEEQVNEIAKLPSGVAVVYQNDWVKPVLTMINRANVTESSYIYEGRTAILTEKTARTNLTRMLMHQWFGGGALPEETLTSSLRVLTLSRKDRRLLDTIIEQYEILEGQIEWQERQYPNVGKLLRAVLGITDKDIQKISSPEELVKLVSGKLKEPTKEQVKAVCFVITSTREGDKV